MDIDWWKHWKDTEWKTKGTIYFLVFCFFIFLPDEEKPWAVYLDIVLLVVLIWAWINSVKDIEDGTYARQLKAEREEIWREYQQAVESQNSSTPWQVRYATEPCPYCGHYKVRNAKWEDKQLSVAFWGIASGKLGKSFKCEHCREMW